VVGNTTTMKASATTDPAGAKTGDASWTSSNPDIATIDSATGVVTGIKAGTTDITCTIDGKTSDKHTVTVTRSSVGGSMPTLTVATTADSNATTAYQWYKNTSKSGTGGTKISGATDASYTPTTVSVAGNTYYYCVATNTNKTDSTDTKSSVSKVFTVTTVEEYGITIEPSSSPVKAGSSLALKAYPVKNTVNSDYSLSTTPITSATHTGLSLGACQAT
jgi:hypothetical protein